MGGCAGYNDVKDDPAMGWARYAHSMRVFCFNSGLFFMRPTAASIALLDKVAHRIETEDGWDQAIFNEASTLKHECSVPLMRSHVHMTGRVHYLLDLPCTC